MPWLGVISLRYGAQVSALKPTEFFPTREAVPGSYENKEKGGLGVCRFCISPLRGGKGETSAEQGAGPKSSAESTSRLRVLPISVTVKWSYMLHMRRYVRGSFWIKPCSVLTQQQDGAASFSRRRRLPRHWGSSQLFAEPQLGSLYWRISQGMLRSKIRRYVTTPFRVS
jgi:hypothetical protein